MFSIKPITDKTIWEDFILSESPQSFFQSWNWGEVEKKEKHEIERVSLYEDNDLVGLSQISTIRAKRGTFLHIRHGPILKSWKKEYMEYLLKYLNQVAQSKKASFIRISPLIQASEENTSILTSFGFRDAPLHAMDGEFIWVLDLNKSEEELLQSMRKTTRYLIKKAKNLGIVIKKSENLSDFFSLYEHTAKRHGFIKHQGIAEEYKIFSAENKCALYTGTYQGKLIAAAVIAFYGNQAIYRHGASIPSDIPAAYLLQWEAIKEAKRRGLAIYNFWGIAPVEAKNHPWKGITLFKTGFGGRVAAYLHAQDKALSMKYWGAFAIEWTRKVKKGYT